MRIWSIGRHFTYPDGESYDILVDGSRQSHATSLEMAAFIVDACNLKEALDCDPPAVIATRPIPGAEYGTARETP